MPLPTSTLIFFLLSKISTVVAQTPAATAAAPGASPNGLIVPFSTGLPVCASKCGPLFDVQGKCTPPNIATVDNNCFCTDSRLTVFNNGGGVSLVCGAQSCTVQSDMDAVKKWYNGFCKKETIVTSTASNGAVATQTETGASRPKPIGQSNSSWISSHYKWVIMIVIMFVAIVGGWIGACLLRRRYLRRKEREIEMKPPVAWGPHQMQGATGGYNSGEGLVDASRMGSSSAGGHAKDLTASEVTPSNGTKAKRVSKALHKINRFT